MLQNFRENGKNSKIHSSFILPPKVNIKVKNNVYSVKSCKREAAAPRNQAVVFENRTTSLLQIECGVPQDSLLGPILSLINDLKATSKILDPTIFADDTNLFLFTHRDVETVVYVNSSIQ